MELLYNLFFNYLSIVIILLLMKYGFGLDFKLDSRGFGFITLAFLPCDLIMGYIANPWIEALGLHFFLLAALLFSLPKKSLKTAFYLIPASAFYAQLDGVVELLARCLGISGFTIPTLGASEEIAVILANFVWIICLLCLKRQADKGNAAFKITAGEGVFLTLLGFIFPFYDIVYTQLEKGFPTRHKIFWVLFCIALNVMILTYFFRKGKMQFYRNVSETYREYYNEEYLQFINYKESQKEMDRFRHDMDNHFLMLQEMLSSREYAGASAYMQTLLKNKASEYYPVLTGNEMLDILIKTKYEKMKEQNITLQVSGNFHVISHMEPIDICIIFSNAIDNAIEACEKVPADRHIELAVQQLSCQTAIIMKNSFIPSEKGKKLFFKNDRDKKPHGLGVGNMETALKKYHGTLYYEQRENQWITWMLLPRPDRLSD